MLDGYRSVFGEVGCDFVFFLFIVVLSSIVFENVVQVVSMGKIDLC